MSTYVYTGTTLREKWDDSTRIYTKYDASGAVVQTRPYTSAENNEADAIASVTSQDKNKANIETALADSLATLQAIIDQTNADIRADPSQEIKDLARTLRRVIRLITRRFDSDS